MPDATLHTLHVPKNRVSVYESGVVDGDECRRRKGKPSLFLLVALNDEYSAGFRAGFFQRAVSISKPVIAAAAAEIERDEMQVLDYGKGSS